MNRRIEEELSGLFARLEDLWERAEQGEVAISAFLSPRERHYAEGHLTRLGGRFLAFGGYEEAERCRIYLLPDYMESDAETTVEELLSDYGMETEIATLRVKGSGYRKLGHRDFLGSLLGLGLSRSVVGDIAVNEEGSEAILFCESAIADFIVSELSAVGNDQVKTTRLGAGEWQIPQRRYAPVSDTVASPRLDGVVAALCGLSREKARQTVQAGLVELNFESEDRPDRTVTSGSLISVRGVGKFRILSLEDRTKKGRYRLTGERFL